MQENGHESNLMKMIEAFKEEMNKSLKEIQENIIKQVEDLQNKTNKHKAIQEKVNEIDKIGQDLKMEIETIKKTKAKAILEMENLGKRTGNTDCKYHQHNTRDSRENVRSRRYHRRN
jgi:DNA repair ATPase RecN